MNSQFLKEQWSLIRAKLKEQYPSLTENDLAYVSGNEESVFDCVERRTGLKRHEVENSLRQELNFV